MPGIICARVLHVRLLIATFRWVISLAVFFILLVFSFPVAMAQSTVREVDASDLTSNHDAPSGDWDVSLAQTPFVLGLGGIRSRGDPRDQRHRPDQIQPDRLSQVIVESEEVKSDHRSAVADQAVSTPRTRKSA